ncbi:phosphatidate cytidylyltransferase [Micromonospora rosaria]|uniref:Phosphatidate cytidylyltransferase n=1 Tax=Micromonospora rosaria TaxID=47874 RepID=A0A136PL26_9ACTN|nr:phosphatidate cytidylyltransferase [Micromonospora rosaria]KXK59170.1 phosphatidate cytidylyltransferase [Micromonospora rosaria]
MSHLDPYSGLEPRGWDRPEHRPALPWPDREIEPAPLAARHPTATPDRTAVPDRPAGAPDRFPPPAGPSADDRAVAPPGDAAPGRYPGGRPDPYADDRPVGGGPAPYADGPPAGVPGPAGQVPDRYPDEPAGAGPWPPGGPYPEPAGDRAPGRRFDVPGDPGDDPLRAHLAPPAADRPGGAVDRGDDDRPTAQFAAIRPEPDPDPETHPPAGRRGPGRRRASAERPPTQQPRSSRAGRNLPAAIGVGLGLGALILVPLFTWPPAFLAVIAGAVGVGIWEMTRAVRRRGAHPPAVPLVAGGVLTIGLAWWAGPDALTLGLLVTVLGATIWRLGDGRANLRPDLLAILLIAVYVPFLGGFTALLAAVPGDGHWRVLVTLVAVVLSDTGGYAAGANLGRHKMAPSISPSKSWEGFAGSLTATALGSAVLIWLLFDVAPWWGALFGVAVSAAAVLGDLAESMIKRDLGIKDMSNLLPGHGGLMDRLDSVLFAVPTAYLILAVLVPVVG